MEVESHFKLTVTELCRACNVDEHWVLELQSHGVLPAETSHASTSIARVRRARRLVHDFDLDVAALALVMDLLDEIERLQSRARSD
jgi:chaperone modulatory protein CbpM